MSDDSSGGNWGGLSVLVAAILTALGSLWAVVARGRKEARADVVAEWKAYADQMRQDRDDALEELHKVRNQYDKVIRDLQARNLKLELENQAMRAEREGKS